MEFLDIPLFDDDFYKMILRFFINLFFLTAIVKYIYHKNNENKDYFFTFYAIGIVVFFLCFTLKKYELDLGMALGLFAIFGILRYRTVPLDVKEMTYLFVIIGVSVMNALSNKKMSYIEIITANSLIVLIAYYFDRYWNKQRTSSKDITYQSLEHIRPEHHEILKTELEEKLGFKILKIEIGQIDFEKQSVKIKIRYNKEI